jgi:hypothetical protein
MKKLTKEQAIVITGYTGITACNFGDFHGDVERRLGHPVFTHEFAMQSMRDKLQEMYREDFLSMLGDEEPA